MNDSTAVVVKHGDIFKSYLQHLAETPERVDSLWMWTLCTIVLWLLMFVNRERMIKGMEGVNLMWEGGEQVTYYTLYAFFAILFKVAFFKESSTANLIALYLATGLIAYQVFGRYIFDWALAFKSGLSSVPEVHKPDVTVTTETKTKIDQP